MMTKEQVQKIVDEHNERVDHFINVELAEKLHAKNGMINTEQWFQAQQLIKEQGFRDEGWKIVTECRSEGFDVKICNDDTLVFYGMIA